VICAEPPHVETIMAVGLEGAIAAYERYRDARLALAGAYEIEAEGSRLMGLAGDQHRCLQHAAQWRELAGEWDQRIARLRARLERDKGRGNGTANAT
jgi:hypothetical protein